MIDAHTRDILEFDLVLERLASRAASSLGREYLTTLAPAPSPAELRTRTAPLRDLITLAEQGRYLPLGGLFDPTDLFNRARIEGSALEEEHWPRLARFFRVAADLAAFRESTAAELPALGALLAAVSHPGALLADIERCFGPDGRLRDNASPGLSSARRALRDAEQRLTRTVGRLAAELHQRGLLQDSFSTLRSGRHVFPVRASHKGRVPGIYHGSSASGETVYIEPLEVLELANAVEATREEERRQVFLILLDLTDRLRPWLQEAGHMVELLRRLDGLQALARLANEKGWNLPIVERGAALRLFNAHHPLIQLSPDRRSVPVTFVLDPGDRCIVLSGPNAGGKTTAMKTLGLHALLALCGAPVPATAGSSLPLFDTVAADIGDRQDIQAGVSTFSGHMQRIRELWRVAGPRSLVLLDELGTGTDPVEGGALALALLEGFSQRAGLTITTSHLEPVKQWAEDTVGARNASFSLDPGTREPTFRLRLDLPGASEALEIAQREGLPPAVLERARALVGERHLRAGDLLRRIEERERALGETLREAEARSRSLQEQERLVRLRADQLREERREARQKSVAEREAVIAELRARLERLIADLPSEEELARRREALVRAREELLREQNQTRSERRALAEQITESGALQVGQQVFVAPLRQWGTIVELTADGQKARVTVGRIEAWAKRAELLDHDPVERRADERAAAEALESGGRNRRKQKRPIKEVLRAMDNQPAARPRPDTATNAGAIILRNVTRATSMELDLHGYRVEEALAELDRFIDRALLAGFPHVRICHGTGTGRLYRAIHEFLRNHRSVRGYRFGTPDEGGGGMTVVTL
jgi:DNA mismatch repair protein MutS2